MIGNHGINVGPNYQQLVLNSCNYEIKFKKKKSRKYEL
jgi:hypothetical protein